MNEMNKQTDKQLGIEAEEAEQRSVVNQASVLEIDTGNKKAIEDGNAETETCNTLEKWIDPFRRRDSISRSPPGHRSPMTPWRSSYGKGEHSSNQDREEVVAQPVKRPRQETPPQVLRGRNDSSRERIETIKPKELLELKATSEMLNKCARELTAAVKGTPNTKAEIKKGAKGINQLAEVIDRQFNELELYCTEIERDTRTSNAVVEDLGERKSGLQEEPRAKTPSNDAGTQVNMGMEEEKIETALAEATSFEEFAQWLGKEWPDSVYVAISMAVGNPPSRSKDEFDMSLIVSPDSMVSEGWLKGMCGRYPDIPEMISDMQEDKIEYLQRATNTCTSR